MRENRRIFQRLEYKVRRKKQSSQQQYTEDVYYGEQNSVRKFSNSPEDLAN